MQNPHADDGAIRAAVRARYAALAKKDRDPRAAAGRSCAPAHTLMEGKLVRLAGYADEVLERLPEGAVSGAYGCGNPLALAGVGEGQTVLDIGSGAGMDCLIAARRVGPSGRVIGIDMTPEMLDRARDNARMAGCGNVEFRPGQAEAIPVEDGTVDWVISNCVINLSPEKHKVFAEIARVLKPGGRFSISDLVVSGDLPAGIQGSLPAWTGCVAGAITEEAYVEGLRDAGLRDVVVASRFFYDAATTRSFVGGCDLETAPAERASLVEAVIGRIWSARLCGSK